MYYRSQQKQFIMKRMYKFYEKHYAIAFPRQSLELAVAVEGAIGYDVWFGSSKTNANYILMHFECSRLKFEDAFNDINASLRGAELPIIKFDL